MLYDLVLPVTIKILSQMQNIQYTRISKFNIHFTLKILFFIKQHCIIQWFLRTNKEYNKSPHS